MEIIKKRGIPLIVQASKLRSFNSTEYSRMERLFATNIFKFHILDKDGLST